MKKLIAALILVSFFTVGASFSAYGQNENKKAPATPETAGMTITRLVIGTSVDNREPVGIAEAFPSSTEKVICFLDAANIAGNTSVTFVWIYGGKEILKTTLPIPAGSRWRTRADKNLYGQVGDWKVEIRSAEGAVLKDVQFKVE